jgi:phosphoribosylaminoimidazolecarboxamide formyltransferase/IMP cyclohydrolase
MVLRALISVSDKTGLDEFARKLIDLGWELFSTGGTKKYLEEAGCLTRPVEDLTSFPEILGGRVKTLHPAVHGGILARRGDPSDKQDLDSHEINMIDLVVVNLYPFVEAVSDKTINLNAALEQIDIGGVTLLRAAAKNFPSVLSVVDYEDYSEITDLLADGIVPLEYRRGLARKVFQHVSFYDSIIAQYLSVDMHVARMEDESGSLPEEFVIPVSLNSRLRYGENPHQDAGLYELADLKESPNSILRANQLNGKDLSFNNILDSDAAWSVVCDFPEDPTITIVKHGNPCGLASRDNLKDAFLLALEGDPVSAFGGIIASNRKIDLPTALEINSSFYEIVIAPSFEPEALEVLQKKKNLRILEMRDSLVSSNKLDIRSVSGGLLVQTTDTAKDGDWNVVTERHPTEEEVIDLKFAWTAVRHVKSNAIIVVKDKSIKGMGAGQPNRLISVDLALKGAKDSLKTGGVLASDAFFPFADGLELALESGISSIIQPGGSVRDSEVIDAANAMKASMIMTGVRHFRH